MNNKLIIRTFSIFSSFLLLSYGTFNFTLIFTAILSVTLIVPLIIAIFKFLLNLKDNIVFWKVFQLFLIMDLAFFVSNTIPGLSILSTSGTHYLALGDIILRTIIMICCFLLINRYIKFSDEIIDKPIANGIALKIFKIQLSIFLLCNLVDFASIYYAIM